MVEPITLTLPKAMSANRYWRTYMPKGFKAPVTTLSQEAKDYKAQVRIIARTAGIRTPIEGRVAINLRMYPHKPQDAEKRMRKLGPDWDDDVQAIDLDNALKVTLDSLKGIAFGDDKWVRKIIAERMEPDGEARVVVTISPIVVAEVQPGLGL